MASIALSNVAKRYGTAPVLKNVSLEIRDGEFITLVGPSGCGKSTLLRILAGLETLDSGSVAIAGRDMTGVRPKSRDIAMVFQSYALYPHLTVERNLAVPLLLRRLSWARRLPLVGRLLPGTRAIRAQIDLEVGEVARALGLEKLLARKPSQLSGGQRQRVAVGRAMVRRPSVFLMDEPLSNLDAKLRVQMRAEIKELHAELGITFVYVTHDQSEAMTLSDRVAVMMDGDLVQVAAPDTLYVDPDDLRVAEFIGSPKINLFEAVVADGGMLKVQEVALRVRVDAPAGTKIVVGVRPESMAVCPPDTRGAVVGRVRLIEHLGADAYVHADVPGARGNVIARMSPDRRHDHGVATDVHLLPDAGAALFFDATGKRLRGPQVESPRFAAVAK